MDEQPQSLSAFQGGHDFPLLQVAERLRVSFWPPPAAGGRMVTGGGGDGRHVWTVCLELHGSFFFQYFCPSCRPQQ